MRRRERWMLADPTARVYPNAVALERSFFVHHDDREFRKRDFERVDRRWVKIVTGSLMSSLSLGYPASRHLALVLVDDKVSNLLTLGYPRKLTAIGRETFVAPGSTDDAGSSVSEILEKRRKGDGF